MKTIDRNKNILDFIKNKKAVTKSDICNQLGISKSTVNRHLKYIVIYNPEIIIKSGNGGGIFWEEKY